MEKSMAVWFEIPVVDMERAAKFYGAVMGFEVRVETMYGEEMGFFPTEGWANGGALTKMGAASPSDQGVVVYLNGGSDLQRMLDRVEPAGGKVLVPKTKISDEVGYYAFFLDTEGNRLALHSNG